MSEQATPESGARELPQPEEKVQIGGPEQVIAAAKKTAAELAGKELQPTEPTKITLPSGRTFELPRTPPDYSPNEWYQTQYQEGRTTAESYVAPMPVEYNDMGIRVDWSPASQYDPEGNPLPEGAYGWTKYGKPSFGDPNDLSLGGDIKAGWNYWKWSFSKPVDVSPEKRKVTAFSKEFFEGLETMEVEEPAGGGFRAEGMRGVPEVGKALFGETMLLITQFVERAKNVDVGNPTANTILSTIGKTATTVLTLFGEGLNTAAYQLKRGLTARYISNEILSEKSTLPDFPVYDEWAGYFMNNVVKFSYEYIRGIESMHRWTLAEREDIKQLAIDASRIGYSGIVVEGLGRDYIKRMQSGADPRILALEMQNPGAEAVGETLLDPLIPLGWATRAARAASVRKISAGKWTAVADPELAKLLNMGAIDDTARAAEHMDDVVRQTGIMYDNTRAGMVTDAATRGARSPTHVSKVHIASRETQDFLEIVATHHGGEPQKFLDTLNGFVDAASPDPVVRARGIDALARSNMTPDMLFSEPANRTAIYLRDLMTDADGVFNPRATVIDDILKAGDDVEELVETATRRLERTYEARNPSIQEQVAQQKKFLELTKTDTAEAARYLDLHPLADTTLSRGIIAVADTHAGLQKWLFRPAYGVMGFLYMSASPAYWMRNRISNAVHVAVTVGPKAAFQAFFFGEMDSLAQIKKMTGGSVPTGAGFGFSPGGADTPSFAKKGFLALAASDEQANARVIVHRVLERELGRVMKEGMAIANPRDFGLADDLADALVQHTKNAWGSTDEAIKALLDSQGGHGRHLGFLTAEQQRLAREYRMYEQMQDAINAGSFDEALDLLDEMEDAWHELGDLAAKEATALDLEGASEIERTATLNAAEDIRKNLGEAESDLFQRQQHAGRVYRTKARDAIDELEKLAISKHQTRVTQTFIEATNELRAGRIDRARELLSYTVEGKTERLIVDWDEFVDIASRGDPKEILEVAGNIAHNDVKFMSQPHTDAIDEMWDLYYKEADAFNDQTRSISRRAGRRNITQEELKALWNEADFGVDPPATLHRDHLRNKIWKRYRPTQQKRFFSVREKMDVLHRLQAEFVGNLGEIPTDTQLMRNADVALETSRLLDEAQLAKDGTAYVERMLAFDTKRFARALEKASDRFDVRIVDGLIEGVEGERGLARIRWGMADPKTGRVPFEISSTLLDQVPDKIKEVIIHEVGHVVLDEIDEAQDLLHTLFDDDVEVFSDVLSDHVRGVNIPAEGTIEAQRIQWLEEILSDPDNAKIRKLLDEVLEIEPVQKKVPVVAPADDAMASSARMAHESRTGVSRYIEEVKQSFKDNWGTMEPPVVDATTRRQMREWAQATDPKVTEARLVATDIANHERDFALHDYGNRIGADLAGGMVYPYHFWYSRTYAKWAKRLMTQPGLIAAYFRYRRYMEKIHAGLPDWWKYQINTNELLGMDMENPLYFNLEATLNPLQGMTGVDFNDPRKRVDWVSRTLDDLGKFGPTTWTPYTLALATAYQIQGKEEASSRWAGRLFTGTRLIRDITALLGAKGGRGIEIDPLIHLFSGGIGPWERSRIGRQLGEMQAESPELDEVLIDAGYRQEGPLWEEAQRRTVNDRAWGNTFGFIFGQGFKPRSETDIQIDRMYGDMYSLIKQKPNYTAEEYRELWDQIRAIYPYMDTILLSRKGGLERDEALAWNVFRRMPPGMSDELTEAAGLPRDTLNTFYDNKGDLAEMSETERMHFMASVIDLSLVLEIPADATVYEWTVARTSYSQMMEFAEGIWGDNIWDRVDGYYAARDEDSRDKADVILKEDPDIEQALDWKALQMVFDPTMAPYYGGLAKIESYYKGLMYDEIERELGEDIFEKWAEYWRRKDMAEDAKAYWDENPELEEYGEIKDRWEPMIAQHIVEFGADLPEPIGPEVREDFEPFVPVQERIAEMVGELGQPRYPQWTRQDWVNELGNSVVNLVDDYTRGEDLPNIVETALERAAERLEMPSGYLTIIGLIQLSGGAIEQTVP